VDNACDTLLIVQLDITLPRMPCEWVSLDAVDASGRVQSAIEHEVFRQRLSSRGRKVQAPEQHTVGPKNGTLPDHLRPDVQAQIPENYCGSCYGAEAQEGECCNTCESVRVAYQKKGWVMPEYDTVEQCKREGYQDSMTRMVR
jgi:endoplasmic reticulum-Golgi intermediate compartment protein 3